ncbi:MAG: hypothetical protein LBR31_05170 [Desulfovibrio sp.]|nr:hypothetical protein [Desulfovibrio sp.]
MTENALWKSTIALRGRFRLCGRLSAVFIATALLCLADGLYASVRSGAEVLELLPGETVMFSGPASSQNPLMSDVSAEFSPVAPDVHFRLDGYFASYWFGSAMWRAAVYAESDARPGRYEMRVRFRASANAQKFLVVVWEDAAARQAGAASVIQRLMGIAPVAPGVACGLCGLLLGILTFFWGRNYLDALTKLGCSEIFRTSVQEEDCRVFCLANGLPIPRDGSACLVFSPKGEEIAQAVMRKSVKGVLELVTPVDVRVKNGCLAQLRRQP